jgi:signal transduction histidine kinase
MNSQDFGSPSKAMEPTNLIQILQTAKDLADSVTSAGKNNMIKKDLLLSIIDSAIVMAVKGEQEKNELAELNHQYEDCSYKHGGNNEMDELRKEISDLKGAFRELQETLKVTMTKPGSFA